MSPLTNITKTVIDKTGETPDILNLPQLIKEEMSHPVLIILNMITDAGFFEDTWSTEKIKSLFSFHLHSQVKKII